MNALDERILDAINTKPGLKVREIATQLGVKRTQVSDALFGSLRDKVQEDRSYRWYPKGVADVDKQGDEGERRLDTPLARLCRYYLDCLNHDLWGVSEFASSESGDPNYVELSALPIFNEGGANPFDSEGGKRLLNRVRVDNDRQILILGYPVRLNWGRSQEGSKGFKVEPLLLFPFQEPDSGYGAPTLTCDPPQINFRALESLTQGGHLEEAILLADELGMGNADNQPELEELLPRLQEIRSNWDWVEEPIPLALSVGEPLARLNQQGIYNRAILVAAERSPYTKGLEYELGKLQAIDDRSYSQSSLGAWLKTETIESSPSDQQPLLEVLPLNSEQRQAVRQSLSNPLTVITGPPGTGKSQVVAAILVNAAWQGKTVLFASKNNKAVDVIETRVNALGGRPILLRVGAIQYQKNLVDYLESLLSATTTSDDQQNYKKLKATHSHLQERSEALAAEVQSIIDRRNEVDRLEQSVETIRKQMGEELFNILLRTDREELMRASSTLQASIKRADRGEQQLLTLLLWPLMRRRRFIRLAREARRFGNAVKEIGLPLPDCDPDSNTIGRWIEFGRALKERIAQAQAVHSYATRLESLTKSRSLEELCKELRILGNDLAANSESLWNTWLRLQPERLDQRQRKLLGDYRALLEMIVSTNKQGSESIRNLYRRCYQLFPRITSALRCWAATSLSVRGRVPLDPGFFDLLLIDEASQCDIASALPLLLRARRVAVIGDPKQLRHISALPKRRDQQLLSKHSLVNDYPGWAYSTQSLFDLTRSLCRSEDIIDLRDHHRSHADIIEFSNRVFYEGRLRIATKYDRLILRQSEPAVRWIDVQGLVIYPSSGGAINEEEARVVVDELERLIIQWDSSSIGVVSPFRAQADCIRNLAYKHDRLKPLLIKSDFISDTAHKFQGDERDVIIFSPMVAPGISVVATRFLRSNPNLFNVAITRARAALVVVGDKTAARNSGVEYLARFASYVDQVGIRQSHSQNRGRDAELGPDYPPVPKPELVSEWERLFYRALYRLGVRPIPQYQVDQYLLDFAVFYGGHHLNIEIDGERYHRDWDAESCRRDMIRNQRLMELGWDIMRFWVYQIRDDLDRCLARVGAWIASTQKT
ncbi:MAG: AAA family ATPase [Chloracidobacterium sp.]|nr:AAA family ATPase [Chloracidobacterium sp.]